MSTPGKVRTKNWRQRIALNGGRSISVMINGHTASMLHELQDNCGEKTARVIERAIHNLYEITLGVPHVTSTTASNTIVNTEAQDQTPLSNSPDPLKEISGEADRIFVPCDHQQYPSLHGVDSQASRGARSPLPQINQHQNNPDPMMAGLSQGTQEILLGLRLKLSDTTPKNAFKRTVCPVIQRMHQEGLSSCKRRRKSRPFQAV